MVEDINNLLNSGDVPNLFMPDEKIEVCEKIRILDKQRDKTIQVKIQMHLFNSIIVLTKKKTEFIVNKKK